MFYLKNNFIIKTKDYFFTKEDFTLKANTKYGFLETAPVPENLNEYYKSEDYISHTDEKKTLFGKTYQFIKKYNLNYKYKKIKPFIKNGTVLDYGCGTGDFLKFLKEKRHLVFGIEPNKKALEITQQKIGASFASNVELKEIEEKFSLITLWHVLEHIPNLEAFLEGLEKHLKDDGKIIIAVPNFKSFDAKYYKHFWAGYDVPRHLWHFCPESLSSLLNHFGMKIEKSYPLWFDSFYVSLLSEKYKGNKFGILTAPIIGLLSNVMGLFTKNYSSIVYQVAKNQNRADLRE